MDALTLDGNYTLPRPRKSRGRCSRCRAKLIVTTFSREDRQTVETALAANAYECSDCATRVRT
jgi:hypothetical protein